MTKVERATIRAALLKIYSEDGYEAGMRTLCNMVGLQTPMQSLGTDLKMGRVQDIATGKDQQFSVREKP